MSQETKKQVSVSAVLALLSAGKTRPEIKTELGLSHKEMVHVFKHPLLKGKRTQTAMANLEIIDDVTPATVEETPAVSETPVVAETATEGETVAAPVADAAISNDWATAPSTPAPVAEEVVQPEVVDDRAPFERG